MSLRRIVIIGAGGAGKSTLAVRLGSILGLPVIHLDQEYWQPGWTKMEKEKWLPKLEGLLAQPEWVMDGNFNASMEQRFAAADTIIYLDFPTYLCLFRALTRIFSYYGRRRPDMAPGCFERFDLTFLKWIWTYRQKVRPSVLQRLRATHGKRIEVLKSPREVSRFLASLTPTASGSLP